jgi:hypothetical protein
MSGRDWADDHEIRRYLSRAHRELLPKLRESAISAVIAPGDDPDPKIAIELGYTLLLDKPLVIVVPPGRTVPEHLVRAADAIVEWPEDGNLEARLMPELRRLGLLDRKDDPRAWTT